MRGFDLYTSYAIYFMILLTMSAVNLVVLRMTRSGRFYLYWNIAFFLHTLMILLVLLNPTGGAHALHVLGLLLSLYSVFTAFSGEQLVSSPNRKRNMTAIATAGAVMIIAIQLLGTIQMHPPVLLKGLNIGLGVIYFGVRVLRDSGSRMSRRGVIQTSELWAGIIALILGTSWIFRGIIACVTPDFGGYFSDSIFNYIVMLFIPPLTILANIAVILIIIARDLAQTTLVRTRLANSRFEKTRYHLLERANDSARGNIATSLELLKSPKNSGYNDEYFHRRLHDQLFACKKLILSRNSILQSRISAVGSISLADVADSYSLLLTLATGRSVLVDFPRQIIKASTAYLFWIHHHFIVLLTDLFPVLPEPQLKSRIDAQKTPDRLRLSISLTAPLFPPAPRGWQDSPELTALRQFVMESFEGEISFLDVEGLPGLWVDFDGEFGGDFSRGD